MSLRASYTLFAPFYDAMIKGFSHELRKKSLAALGEVAGQAILLPGVGTGLDLPHLPPGARYTGIDLTPAMLSRARKAVPEGLEITLQTGDAMALPFTDQQFDGVIMHLILAVVPRPQQALKEAARVLKPGGRILILDKFLRADESAWLKRAVNPLISRLATRTDVIFEPLLAELPQLSVRRDEPAGFGGWFRYIELRKD